MRILILGNMANDGYAVAKELRKMNKDVDLAVNSSDFGMALPEWEDAELSHGIDPYLADGNTMRKYWIRPPWIRYFDFMNRTHWKNQLWGKIKSRIDVIKMMREYDIVETHVPFSIYSQFSGVPYVVYDAGWIRYFPYSRGIRDKLARRGYSKAKSIIITNPDTFEISDGLPYLDKKKIFFSPFAIDTDKYRPMDARELRSQYAKDDEILLFSPSRQSWKEKGNDKMIRAFARFAKQMPGSKFIMVAWSEDEQNSKSLVESLGISDKIIWIKPVPKNQLIRYYNAADIILDQFVLGSWGTSTPEAMACGKPVLMFYKKEYILRAFGKEPPILSSLSDDDIYSNLLKIAKDPEYAADMGNKSREWIIETHSSRVVAQRHLEILQKSA
ncbi:MAG TPA: glycosyltransferase family 4 protein [Nitrososphaera sp.]|jgi:glycosyltransferase involved in cell wall biosynthesis